MNAQQLLAIANLIPLLAAPIQQAISALLNRGGIDPDKLLEMAGANNQTALTMIESEINRVGANLPPTEKVQAEGKALLSSLKKK